MFPWKHIVEKRRWFDRAALMIVIAVGDLDGIKACKRDESGGRGHQDDPVTLAGALNARLLTLTSALP
jgi:hypothetical protein